MGAAIGEWQRGPVIGRGASATVSIAADRSTGQVFAVKSVEMARAGVLKREQSVLSALSASPYVVSCRGSGVSAADGGGERFDLFLEYAPGGSLADEIKRRGGRCEETVIRARAADVLRGLAFAHAAGVAHCDVKARNVLLGADGRAMLADFGCARWINTAAATAVGVVGTPVFMAPEAARGKAQGAAGDIWALGCTVIEMATGAAPWAQKRLAGPAAALHHVAHSGEVPGTPACLSDEGKDFLSRCLVGDPAARWTAGELLQHPFVASAAAKGALPIEQRVSPKSILDQGFWDDEEPDSSAMDEDSDTSAALDRVRALAGGGVAPDWTWIGGDEHWITVCAVAGGDSNQPSSSSSEFEADTPELLEAEAVRSPTAGASEEAHIGGGEHMASRGREGHDDGGQSSSDGAASPGGDSAAVSASNDNSNNECCSSISGNCPASASNDGDDRNQRTTEWVTLTPPSPRPSWQPFFHFFPTLPLPRAFFFPVTFPASSFPSRARRER